MTHGRWLGPQPAHVLLGSSPPLSLVRSCLLLLFLNLLALITDELKMAARLLCLLGVKGTVGQSLAALYLHGKWPSVECLDLHMTQWVLCA